MLYQQLPLVLVQCHQWLLNCRGEGWDTKYPTIIEEPALNIVDCSHRCDITPDCTGFNRYVEDNGNCVLYYNPTLAAEDNVPGLQCWKRM